MNVWRVLERRFPRLAGSAVLVVPAVLVLGLALAAALTAGSNSSSRSSSSLLPAPTSPSTTSRTSTHTSGPAATREPVEPAAQPALRFLRGYLAYSYGHGAVQGIPDASRSVLEQLRRQHARVPLAAAGGRPRVTTLQVVRQGPRSVQATATVADGSGAQYPLVVFLDFHRGRWIVSGLGDD